MLNKRGVSWKPFGWTIAVVGAVILIFMLVRSDIWPSKNIVVDTATTGFDSLIGAPFSFMNFIFGGVPTYLVTSVGQTSAIVVTIAVFLLIFVTFADIIDTFGTFSSPVAWFVGFLIAAIAANLKGIVVVVGAMTGIFAFLGAAAVFVGLGACFVAFLVVNLGIKGWMPWLMRRKAATYAMKAEYKTKTGAAEVGAAIKGMKDVGKALKS
ncbi:MAG: hypothetical protein KKD18_01290 [Nanoarchaeota archaeon]|nr:hypothetical protein [Nanoarchaeota archaeon]MBU0977028.1 hypothetical protein [Nanoarchaeota archaeon]